MKIILQFALLGGWIAAAGATATGSFVTAADPKAPESKSPSKATSSLDDELFKDLDDGSGKPKTAVKPDAAPEAKSTTEKPAAKPDNAAKPDTAAKPDPAAKPDVTAKPAVSSKPADDVSPPAEAKPLPKPSNPLDAELLKDLEGDQPEQKKKPKSEQQPAPGAAGKSDSDDPLVRLSRQIREAESRIRRSESGEETQRLQRDIVEDLEKLIAQIEQRQQQSQGKPKSGPPKPGSKPGNQKPGQPQQKPGDDSQPSSDSTDKTRKMADKKADPGKLKNMLEEVWGRLPERQRQDVMQSSVDDFPVKYQYVIEEYFRTLLERREKPISSWPPTHSPPDADSSPDWPPPHRRLSFRPCLFRPRYPPAVCTPPTTIIPNEPPAK
jgi:hypothetical protein